MENIELNNNINVTDIEVDGWDSDVNKYLITGLIVTEEVDEDGEVDTNEETVDVAYINLRGEIEYINGYSKETVPDVEGVVEQYIADFLFSSKMDETKKALSEMVYTNWRPSELTVRNPDGYTTYAMEEHDILGHRRIYAGMYESDGGAMWCVPLRSYMREEEKRDYADRLADWLIDDITSAVGDEWVIEPSAY